MAYNNYYQPMQPAGAYQPAYQVPYQPQYQQQYQPQYPQQYSQPQQTQNGGMIWVENYNEAAMYPVAPNAAVVLWDRSNPCVYVKKADATGKPSLTIYDLVERKENTQQENGAANPLYATKTDLKAVSDTVEALRDGLKEMRLKIESKASGEAVFE